jgi:hypothetical protein
MKIPNGERMKRSTRGTIKKLKKLSQLKAYAPIRDRLMAVVYVKKSGRLVKFLDNFTAREYSLANGRIDTATLV